MLSTRRWFRYHSNYRAPQMERVAQWIANGRSCAVVGMAGCGKSNFLGCLAHKPNVLSPYLGAVADQIVLVPVDLNSLPNDRLDTFFRLLLRSFYEIRACFDEETAALVSQQYEENRAATDPFLPQSGLRTLLFHFDSIEKRIVFVMDRFDRFVDRAIPGMTDTLRSLRDRFKDTVCFVVGMRAAPKYALNQEMAGELYEILDLHLCWVGSMGLADSQRVIAEELHIAENALDKELVTRVYGLTGGYPSLLKAVCQRYLENQLPEDEWHAVLIEDAQILYRLENIWKGLTQQEQMLLYTLALGDTVPSWEGLSLADKGIIERNKLQWRVKSQLLNLYAATVGQLSRGMIWEEQETGVLYQGRRPLDQLAPTEAALLVFFVRHPYKRHAYSEIITAVWTEVEDYDAVTPTLLSKHVTNLRQKIEPNPSNPIYLINYRAKPEGGYQLFPEGRPS